MQPKATDKEKMQAKYRELMLGVVLMDVLMEEEREARQVGVTADELMDRRREALRRGQRPPSEPHGSGRAPEAASGHARAASPALGKRQSDADANPTIPRD